MKSITLSNGRVISDPEERIRDYLRVEVYSGYDDHHDITDTIGPDSIVAANRIFARISGPTGKRMIQSEAIRRYLQSIANRDLGAIGDDEWESYRNHLELLLSAACSLEGVRIAVATKVLHLKRPKLIPILDSFVVKFLLWVQADNIVNKERLVDVACDAIDVIRTDLMANHDSFASLQESLSNVPVRLENVRLYDILVWSTEKWDVRGDSTALYGTPSTAKAKPAPGCAVVGAQAKVGTDMNEEGSDWFEIASIEKFRETKTGKRGYVVITDTATGNKTHRPGCKWVREDYFLQKVVDNGCRNGHYYWTNDLELAERRWRATRCPDC